MDDTNQDEQVLLTAFSKAPPFIQDFLESGEFGAFMTRLTEKVSLDASTKAKVSNELFMTLLGITMPADLPANLATEAGVPENLIPVIIEEAREGIFEPLIARGGGEPASDLPAVISQQPIVTSPAPKTIPVIAPVASRPLTVPSPSRSTAPPSLAKSTPSIPRGSERQETNVYETFHARTMASDVEAIGQKKDATVPERSVSPPPSRPAPNPIMQDLHTDLKKYGIDPYREPIE
jgi:hypothetical protein